jgi:dTDP-4-dehydrorhamnose 3,5-epimerase
MEFEPTSIPEVVLIRPQVHGDARGFFLESWHQEKFAAGGIAARFVQDNHSRSVRHTLRGLHYQIVRPQGKLVMAINGSVFDVAIDLRRGSPTFGKWVAAQLDDVNHHCLWIPPGFAHGFLVLSESADVVYKCTEYYSPGHDRSIKWNDRELDIAWPLPHGAQPILSRKDAEAARFRDAELFP